MIWQNRFGKFNAKKVRDGGFLFDSKAEHKRWTELLLLEKAQEISDITVHPVFDLKVMGVLICRYEVDLAYFDKKLSTMIYEEIKGHWTPEAKLKVRLFRVLYPDLMLHIIQA